MIDPLTALGFGVGVAGVNNLLAQHNAETSYKREKELMAKQNQYNVENAKNARMYDVEGMRLAGLNPALAQNGSPSVPSASVGSADMSQTIPFSPADSLLMAQTENVNADTDLKRTEIPNKVADTNLKFAETLFKNAGTEKIKAEIRHIQNINDQYKDENTALSAYGQTMAQKWQSTPWYAGLAPDTKNTIDLIASGEMPLSVGSMTALERVILAQKNLSDADRAVVKNAFDNAVTEMQFNDESVMKAISLEPKDKRNLLYKHIDEITTAMDKMKAEIPNIVQELENLKSKKKNIDIDTLFNEAKAKAFKAGDLDYLKSQGEYGKWLEKYAEDRLTDVFKMAPAIAGGRAIGSSMKIPSAPNPAPPIFKPTASDYDRIFPASKQSAPWYK